MSYPGSLMQISQAFQPKVDAPGAVIGQPQPMQIQQQQQMQRSPGLFAGMEAGPGQLAQPFENPNNSQNLHQANMNLVDAGRAYEEARTPVTTGLGRLGVLEGIARHFTSKDEKDAYYKANEAAQYEALVAQEQAAQARADDVFQMAAPIVGPQEAKAMAQRSMTDAKYGQQVQQALLEEHQRLREVRREDEREQIEENELYGGLVAMGIPAKQARAFSQMEGANIDNIAEMYFGRQDELRERQEQEYERAIAMNREKDEMRNSIRQVERTMKVVGPWSAGFGSYLNMIRGTDAKDLQTMLDTQKATIAFERLQAMRTDPRNETGGALGNVSNREVALLYSSFTGLNEEMSDDQLRTSLSDIAMGMDIALYGLEKEAALFEAVKAGQMTEDDAAVLLEREAYNFANQRMIERSHRGNISGLPKEAQQEALAAVMGGELHADDFESTFGWRPAVAGDRHVNF